MEKKCRWKVSPQERVDTEALPTSEPLKASLYACVCARGCAKPSVCASDHVCMGEWAAGYRQQRGAVSHSAAVCATRQAIRQTLGCRCCRWRRAEMCKTRAVAQKYPAEIKKGPHGKMKSPLLSLVTMYPL